MLDDSVYLIRLFSPSVDYLWPLIYIYIYLGFGSHASDYAQPAESWNARQGKRRRDSRPGCPPAYHHRSHLTWCATRALSIAKAWVNETEQGRPSSAFPQHEFSGHRRFGNHQPPRGGGRVCATKQRPRPVTATRYSRLIVGRMRTAGISQKEECLAHIGWKWPGILNTSKFWALHFQPCPSTFREPAVHVVGGDPTGRQWTSPAPDRLIRMYSVRSSSTRPKDFGDEMRFAFVKQSNVRGGGFSSAPAHVDFLPEGSEISEPSFSSTSTCCCVFDLVRDKKGEGRKRAAFAPPPSPLAPPTRVAVSRRGAVQWEGTTPVCLPCLASA